jgi:hypothetical protein
VAIAVAKFHAPDKSLQNAKIKVQNDIAKVKRFCPDGIGIDL